MKYLCLVYFEPTELDALSPEDRKELDRNSIAYDRELERDGLYILASALRPAREAATVRVREGRMTVTDGPFAETREQLGGFILVEARDMNEAIRIAAGIPLAGLGSIEVRPTHAIEA